MNNIKKIDTEVTLSDLRLLGRQGHATARLFDGTTLQLRPNEAVREQMAYISGEKVPVLVAYDYPKIYGQIRTIKRGDVIVARRARFGDATILRLTGQGFVRPDSKSTKKIASVSRYKRG